MFVEKGFHLRSMWAVYTDRGGVDSDTAGGGGGDRSAYRDVLRIDNLALPTCLFVIFLYMTSRDRMG